MMNYKIAFSCILLSLSFNGVLRAQDTSTTDLKNWYQRDLATDSFYGISLKKAYQFLQGKKSKQVVVAVIDAGIDTAHEDLKSVIWQNPKEIPNNGIDDDHNGFVDDVHGWNFLGNKNGANIDKAPLEKVRVYYRFKDRFAGKNMDTLTLSPKDKYEYLAWKRADASINNEQENSRNVQILTNMQGVLAAMQRSDSILKPKLSADYTFADAANVQVSDQAALGAKNMLGRVATFLKQDPTAKVGGLIKEIQNEYESKKKEVDAVSTPPEDVRGNIIKDNYADFNDGHYGNNDVNGLDPMHGTHVSGIIAAQRNNGIGMDGIADNVKIMVVRAVPDGDEYDKDIAHAIRYAVDNGAKVINMSFGKAFSPEKYWVDSAFAYAASKDVLLIHAAGNEGEDIDTSYNYPSTDLTFYNHSRASNVITVGASGDTHIEDGNLVASFSNYGKKNVDVFAPGVKIYSTLPIKDQYGFLQGTSMASPVVAGIAALIRSYYPKLSAVQVKYIIEHSLLHPTQKDIAFPGDNTGKGALSDISVYGGIVNAYNALKMASVTKPKKG